MVNTERLQIFICGSYSDGFVHFSRIKKFVSHLTPAKIKGSAYRLKVGYPVVVEEGKDCIEGQIAEFIESESLLHLLDGFYGYNADHPDESLYIRKQIVAESKDSLISVWTYFLNPTKLPMDAKLIEGGDWQGSLKTQPTFCERLSERQRSYILKLGASSGREIVPIDMSLYRELISMELIVDKGRRLALSKFGSEVFRYLA